MARQLAKNIGFLTLSQAANYVLPLVTIPYITRIVGPENYGSIEFATVVMLYFSAVVIYGFSYTATRKIAENPSHLGKVSSVFSTVMLARLYLFGASTLVFAVLLFAVPQFAAQKKVMLVAYPIVLGWALYPDFLFQGLQKLKVVALANTAIKLLAAIFVFMLLHKKEDFYLVLAINSAAQVVVSVATLGVALATVKGLRWYLPRAKMALAYLKSGWYVFLSHFFTRVYTFGTIIFLGVMLSERELGLFAAAMKLVIVGQSFLFMPLGGALFPYLANLYKTNVPKFVSENRKFTFLLLVGTTLATTVVVLFPSFFVTLVFGSQYLEIIPMMQWMMPILIVSTWTQFSTKQGLIIMKEDKRYLNMVILTGVLSLVLNLLLIYYFKLWGAVWAKVAVEVLLAVFGGVQFSRALKRKLAT